MSEDDALPAEGEQPGFYVEQERTGIAMAEVESLERVIEGLKSAADGARHLGMYRNRDDWSGIADRVDRMRSVAVQLSGNGNINAAATSLVSIRNPMPIGEALKRYVYGLRQAAGGAKQMATYHRMSMEWLEVNKALRLLEEKGKALMKVQMQALRPSFLLPASYH